MSEFARIGIVTTLFVVLLSIGSAVGIFFYFNNLPETVKPLPSPAPGHLAPNLSRSDKTDSVFDLRQRLGQDGRGRPNDKPAAAESPDAPEPVPPSLQAATEPNFEPPAATEDNAPAQTGAIRASAEPEPTDAVAEPDPAPTAPAQTRQRAATPSGTAALGAATPSKAIRRPAPCRSEECRQALAECTKVCDTAMTLSITACPRVASGASEKDEKECLAKWDRRRNNCRSGCALRQARAAAKTP